MLYKSFVCAGNSSWSGIAYCWRRLQADTDPTSVKCWASITGAGQYPFSPSQYFMLEVLACWRYWHDTLNQSWVNVGPPSLTLAHIQSGTKHSTVTQYWANVSCLTENAQTERTEVKQHVPTSLWEGRHNQPILLSILYRFSIYSLVRYVILAISVAKIDFIVFMASLGVK